MIPICSRKGRYLEYYFEFTTLRLVSGYGHAFLDKNMFTLEHLPVAAGQDILLSLPDLEKIYAPYLEVKAESDTVELAMEDILVRITMGSRCVVLNGETVEWSDHARPINGIPYLPAGQLMQTCFGKTVISSKNPQTSLPAMHWNRDNTVLEISGDREYTRDSGMIRLIEVNMRGKTAGELYKTFWFEEAGKIMPYNLFIPSTYDPRQPSKLLVTLHGGVLPEQWIYQATQNKIQLYCEQYQYILLCPNACVRNSTYGSMIPNHQWLIEGIQNPDDRENPMSYSEETIALMKLGERCVLRALELVKREYTIDENLVFLQGNSMGGIGTFHLAASYPGTFRAICPTGGCPDMDYFALHKLTDIPVRFVIGTEDEWGFDYLKEAADKLCNAGCNLELRVVGGGTHSNTWVQGLEETFTFFEKHA